MSEVIIIIHLVVVLSLVGIVLIQRSEGGGLGMGGGGGGFLTSRGKANILTRTTAVLAGLFFLTSLVLAILAVPSGTPRSLLDTVPTVPGAPPQGGILDQLPKTAPAKPAAPQAPISK